VKADHRRDGSAAAGKLEHGQSAETVADRRGSGWVYSVDPLQRVETRSDALPEQARVGAQVVHCFSTAEGTTAAIQIRGERHIAEVPQ
jgi:hypothetical protein